MPHVGHAQHRPGVRSTQVCPANRDLVEPPPVALLTQGQRDAWEAGATERIRSASGTSAVLIEPPPVALLMQTERDLFEAEAAVQLRKNQCLNAIPLPDAPPAALVSQADRDAWEDAAEAKVRAAVQACIAPPPCP